MLQCIIGTAGTGKTTYLTSLAAELAAKASEPLLLLVPEQASFYYEKRMLGMLGARDAERMEVLSFSRLAETVLPRGHVPVIDDGGRAVLMSIALESLSEKLEVYSRYAGSLSVANELLKLSAEFKRCMVSPEALRIAAGAMPDGFLKKKLGEIALILETYDVLVAGSYTDDTDDLTRLSDYLAEQPVFRGKTVLLDAFSGFTVQEYAVLFRILAQADSVYVSLCTDSIFSPGAYDPGAFAYVRRTAEKLMHIARRLDVPVQAPIRVEAEHTRFQSSELSALERIFAAGKPTEYALDARRITVLYASDLYEECAAVAARVKRLLREENYRCREIAVLFRDAARYEAPVRAALAKCGVPVFEDKRQPICTQPPISLVRGICTAAAEGFSTDTLMQIAKTGLTALGMEEIAVLENYALLWDIRPAQWKKPFTGNPEGMGEPDTQETAAALEMLNGLRQRLVRPLERFCDAVRETDGKGFAAEIYRFLQSQQVNEHLRTLAIRLEERGETAAALEQERIWDLLMEILDMFARTLADRPTAPKRFLRLLDVVLQTCSLGSIPQGLDEVTVGDVDRTVPVAPRAVFVAGVQEGVFPRTPSAGGLLTLADRRQLKELGMELYDFGEVKVTEERFLVYKTLCSASERLTVSTCSLAEDGTRQCGSEILRTIAACFPQCTHVSAADIPLPDKIESDATAFEQLCLQSREAGELYPELREYFAADAVYRTRVETLERICTRGAFRIQNKALADRLFGRHMYLSASRVESYYKCPFAYFCRYGLLAKPRKKAEFDPAVQGTEIHFVLETILRRFGREGLLALTAEQRQAQIDEILDEYLLSRLGGSEKTKRFLYLYNRLRKTMGEILERLVLEFAVCRFEPVDFELKIDRDGDIPPYTVELADGGSVQIKGFVDRVDTLELDGKTYVRVVDYKSGGKKFALSDVLSGLNMQMLIYLFAIWENGQDYYKPPIVPAGVLYMPAKADFEKISRELLPEEAALAKAKALRMNGMLLDNDTVLLQMDSTQSGCFIPVGQRKTVDSLISLTRLSQLKKETEKLLRTMAGNLRSGAIEALPAHSSCDYCDYRSVCGREDGDPEREIASMRHAECLRILDERQAQTDAMD